MSTREIVMTLEFEGTDPKTNQRATMMVMVADMWIAPEVPGYAEVREFHQRMARKLNWVPGAGGMMGGGQESAKGMAEMYKEMGKLNGMPVLQLTKMNMGGAIPQGEQPAAAGATPPPPQPEVQQPQQQQVDLERPTVGGALGRLGGRLGGLGKKKQTPEQTSGSQPQAQAAGGPPSMMEMTSELSGFSSAAADASKFEVPAGFKQVESPTLKATQSR
jgi:hypothetical protein